MKIEIISKGQIYTIELSFLLDLKKRPMLLAFLPCHALS